MLGTRRPAIMPGSTVEEVEAELAQIRARKEAELKQTAAERRVRGAAQAKVDKELPALAEALAAQFRADWEAAIDETARTVAEQQLQRRHGLSPHAQVPDRVRLDHVERTFHQRGSQ